MTGGGYLKNPVTLANELKQEMLSLESRNVTILGEVFALHAGLSLTGSKIALGTTRDDAVNAAEARIEAAGGLPTVQKAREHFFATRPLA